MAHRIHHSRDHCWKNWLDGLTVNVQLAVLVEERYMSYP